MFSLLSAQRCYPERDHRRLRQYEAHGNDYHRGQAGIQAFDGFYPENRFQSLCDRLFRQRYAVYAQKVIESSPPQSPIRVLWRAFCPFNPLCDSLFSSTKNKPPTFEILLIVFYYL